jgi:hypothetical protein
MTYTTRWKTWIKVVVVGAVIMVVVVIIIFQKFSNYILIKAMKYPSYLKNLCTYHDITDCRILECMSCNGLQWHNVHTKFHEYQSIGWKSERRNNTHKPCQAHKLEMNLKETQSGCGLHSTGNRQEPVACPCEHGDEPLGSKKDTKFLD